MKLWGERTQTLRRCTSFGASFGDSAIPWDTHLIIKHQVDVQTITYTTVHVVSLHDVHFRVCASLIRGIRRFLQL